MTLFLDGRRAGAMALACLLAAPTGALAFDLNPFHRDAPQQTAQSNVPPGAIPGDSVDAPDGGDPAALVVRLDRLEADLRRATGQIEELQNQNHRLEDELKRFRDDVEFRLSGAKDGAAAAPAPAPLVAAAETPVVKPRKSDAFDPAADASAVGAPRPLGVTPPSSPLATPLGVRPTPPAGAPLDLSGRVTPTGPLATPAPDGGPTVIAGVGVGFTDGPREQYAAALDAYRAGQYPAAETQFKAFLAANANHRLAPDATFFLGETYLQRSRPREAAEQYLKLSTDFSKSSRAPEGMMRLGQSLAMLGNSEQACATFTEIGKRYPTAATTVKKSVEREMTKDHC